MLIWHFVEILVLVVLLEFIIPYSFSQKSIFRFLHDPSLLRANGWYLEFCFTLSGCCTWCREQDSIEITVHQYEKTLVA